MQEDGLWRLAALTAAALVLSIPRPARADVPENGWVIWMSNRADGRGEIYRSRADGSEIKRLTDQGGIYPNWSPDGRWISYQTEAGEVFFMRPDGSEKRKLSAPAPEGAPPFWLHDNSGLVHREPDGNVFVVDPDTMEKTLLFKISEFPNRGGLFHLYSMTHDNRYLFVASDIFLNGLTVSNGTYKLGYSAVLIDLLDHKKYYLVGPGCWPFTPPEGNLVYHINGDRPTWPDIYRMNLADLQTRSSYEAEVAHPDADWGHEYHPRISNDNKWVIYMTSNGCHWDPYCNNEIFIHRLGTPPSERTQVTHDESFDAFPGLYVGPLWAPSAAPRPLVTPNRLMFYARGGVAPAAQALKVKNGGGGALGAAKAVVDPPVGWLDVQPAKGGFAVSMRGAGLVRGIHRTTITVTIDGADGPLVIPVSLDADESFRAEVPDAAAPPVVAGDADGGATDGSASADAGATAPKSSGCALAGRGAAGPGAALAGAAALLVLARRRRSGRES
jgi:hypothetical protein